MPPSPVLLLTNQLTTGGAERYVVTVSAWLAEQGVRTIVAATPGELADQLHRDVVYHPMPLRDLRWTIPLAALRVARLIRRYRPRVILANSLVTAAVARLATLAHPRRRLPILSVAHGWPAERYRLVARPLALADRVVAVSDDVARRLMHAGLPPRRCVTVPNGVDLSPFGPRSSETLATARAAFGAGPEDVVITSVGRYVEQKAQHRIVHIAAALPPHVRVGIIGWGPLEADLRRQIDEARLQDRVRLLVRRSDVPDLLMASDLYLSTSDWEGMPLSTIEAMAAGLPIVATDVEGMSALVDDANGILCPPGDLPALTEAVRALVDDEPRRLTLGSHGRQRAEQRFSREVMCRRLAAVMDEVARGY